MTRKINDNRISSFLLPPSSLFSYILNVVYLIAILLVLPWLVYQRVRYGKYREGWDAKFWGGVPKRTGNKPCIWLHAVSVGEVNLLEPILSRWERLAPEWDCVISTTTQTGYALARKKYAPRTVVYCPLDFTWAVRRAMRRIRPTILVLTELELWPNLISAARRHGAKVAVINGRLSEKSFRGYRRIRWLVRRVLQQVDLVAVQNDDYAERFLSLGALPQTVQTTRSIKFDGARTSRDTAQIKQLKQLAGIEPDDIVFLAGSTQDPEESIALAIFERLSSEFPRLKLILVPRHPERFEDVAALLDRSGVKWQRRSRIEASGMREHPGNISSVAVVNYRETYVSRSPALPRILLVDAVGELGHWWGTARIAFVGGSLTQRGGQNMIEPAGYGTAVSFGPNTWNFRDVVGLMLDRQAAVVVRNEQELEAYVRRCLTDKSFADELGRRAQELVVEQQGAADRTIDLLHRLIANNATGRRTDEPHKLQYEQKRMKETKNSVDQSASLGFLRSLLFKIRTREHLPRRGLL
jgi:3-deoxy-D-manno-octulosonic-acid transferase